MKNLHIIHFVESNNRHEWLENLISLLDAKGFSQSLVSIEPQGAISSYLSSNFPHIHVKKVRKNRLNIFTGVIELIQSRKKNSINIVFALGHPAAVITAVTSCFVSIDFVFSHMQQPRYFELMKPKWKGTVHTELYRFYLHRADLIHSLSQEVRDNLVKYGINQRKVLSINIGVNFDKIHRELIDKKIYFTLPEGSPKILMVGRLAPEKNYETALRAFATFLESRPQAILLIAGEGPMKQQLKSLAEHLLVSHNVHFLGYIGNIPSLMAKVDILLHLATTESYGQIYIEAVLSGLPVVCTPTGVSVSLMKEKSANIFVSKNDSEQRISENLDYCLTNIKKSSFDRSTRFSLYYEHDEKYVHRQIADSFLTLSAKSHED